MRGVTLFLHGVLSFPLRFSDDDSPSEVLRFPFLSKPWRDFLHAGSSDWRLLFAVELLRDASTRVLRRPTKNYFGYSLLFSCPFFSLFIGHFPFLTLPLALLNFPPPRCVSGVFRRKEFPPFFFSSRSLFLTTTFRTGRSPPSFAGSIVVPFFPIARANLDLVFTPPGASLLT